MNLEKYKYIYLIGIGGIGMSALARYFNFKGYVVYGYDGVRSLLCTNLEKEGMSINYNENNIPNNIKKAMHDELLVIYTPAVSFENTVVKFFLDKKFTIHKRAEVLGYITKKVFTIAVAGTHGKTTTATILSHLLYQSGLEITAFLGGISNNYKTNILLSEKNEIFIVEADEYDRSFLQLYADIAIITSVDADHMDIYNDLDDLKSAFIKFATQVKNKGCLFVENNIDIDFPYPKHGNLYRYSAKEKSDYYAENINIQDGKICFDINFLNIITGKVSEKKMNLDMLLPGVHNVSNAIAALAVGTYLGLPIKKMANKLSIFEGIERRFDRHIETEKLVYIDDYAHHPSELKQTINTVKQLYPERKITAFFQPHLFSRTKDFAEDFADSLSEIDDLFLLDIYPAREDPIVGINSNMLLEICKNKKRDLCSKEDVLNIVSKRKIDILLTLGAGDISSLVNPIKEVLN